MLSVPSMRPARSGMAGPPMSGLVGGRPRGWVWTQLSPAAPRSPSSVTCCCCTWMEKRTSTGGPSTRRYAARGAWALPVWGFGPSPSLLPLSTGKGSKEDRPPRADRAGTRTPTPGRPGALEGAQRSISVSLNPQIV